MRRRLFSTSIIINSPSKSALPVSNNELNLAYQFFLHTETKSPLDKLGAVFNTHVWWRLLREAAELVDDAELSEAFRRLASHASDKPTE